MNPYLPDFPEMSSGRDWLHLMLSHLASPVTALSMIRRSAPENIGLFDPEFGGSTDIDMWIHLCEVGDVEYVNELLLFVRGRGPDHPYTGMNGQILDEVIRTHRKHLRLHYGGAAYVYWKLRRELEIDFSLLFSFLNSFRHRRWDDIRRGRKYLRSTGVCLSRVAGWLL